jgi:hypothetical protein
LPQPEPVEINTPLDRAGNAAEAIPIVRDACVKFEGDGESHTQPHNINSHLPQFSNAYGLVSSFVRFLSATRQDNNAQLHYVVQLQKKLTNCDAPKSVAPECSYCAKDEKECYQGHQHGAALASKVVACPNSNRVSYY